jgi:hypothetical protein
MRNETLLSLLDVIQDLTIGYRECAQKIYAAEFIMVDYPDAFGKYLRAKTAVMTGQAGMGLESERWNESAGRIEKEVSELRKKLLQNPDGG